MVKIGEMMMILDLHRQGLSVAAIARETGKDAKTIRRYIARGLEPPVYGPPPQPCRIDPYKTYLQERIAAYPPWPRAACATAASCRAADPRRPPA